MAFSKLSETDIQKQEKITCGIIAGDEQAFQTFFEDTNKKGVLFATFMLHNRHDAEDVVQQTYAKLIEIIKSKSEPIHNIFPLFWRYLRWRCLDKLDKVNREQAHRVDCSMNASNDGDGLNHLQNVPEDNSDFLPMEALLQKDKRDAVIKAIDTLPEQEKAAISLRYMAGMSVNQAAQALEKSPGTIKAQIFAAKRHLQKVIGAPDQFYALVGLPVLTRIFEQEIQSGGYMLPAVALESLHAQAATAATEATTAATTATAATEASTAATTAAGASTASTITMGAGILGKIAALTTGTKVALAVAAAVVIGGGGTAYAYHANAEKQAEVAAIIQQQEEQARLNAEQAARAAEQRAKEEEAARKAEAERIAAEQAKAEETARQAEAERITAEETKAKEDAQEAARKALEAEQAAAQAPTTPGNGPEGADGLPSTGPVDETPGGVSKDEWGNGHTEYIGKPEPDYRQTGAKNSGPLKRGEATWDSSIGGWVDNDGMIIYPDGNCDISNIGK